MFTEADMNKLTRDYYFRDPAHVVIMLQCAAESGDEAAVKEIFGECKKRGIDIGKALQDDLERHERLWGKMSRGKTFSGGREIKTPFVLASSNGKARA